MTSREPFVGDSFSGGRLLTLVELCAWLNITERHARKLVEREAIPYRKVGHLLRFSRADVDAWSQPVRAHESQALTKSAAVRDWSQAIPKSLLD